MRWLKRILAFFVVLIASVAAIVIWIWRSFPTASYRYRLTIAVEFDGKVHSGSSVIEAWYRFFPHWAAALSNGSQFDYAIQGEAVVIDLDNGGVLIAALGYNRDPSTVPAGALAARAFDPPARHLGPDFPASFKNVRVISRMRGPVDLAPDNLPPFIWLSDRFNPQTARQVKPNEFASVIGDAARLVTARVEITTDPVVIDIDKRLPWYQSYQAAHTKGTHALPDTSTMGATRLLATGTLR